MTTQARTNDEMHHQNDSAIIFCPELARKLANECRLPPTYIGVRRVRPSSKMVRRAWVGKDDDSSMTIDLGNKREEVVFKTVDEKSGLERRMTASEKKTFKRQLAKERLERKNQGKLLKAEKKFSANCLHDSTETDSKESSCDPALFSCRIALGTDRAALQQELDDLRGERVGVPPVALASYMAAQLFHSSATDSDAVLGHGVVFDVDFAKDWAAALATNLKAAEDVRSGEDVRPMVYKLLPEPWMRMNPLLQSAPAANRAEEKPVGDAIPDGNSLAWLPIRPPSISTFDQDTKAAVQLIHQQTALHMSCGSKFGCDLLLYDGPRSDRHAFAGVRIYSMKEDCLPLPTAYELAGYVRGLNSAGKLALLAMVHHESEDEVRVAIVDVALQKVANSTFERKHKTMKKRLETLSKK